ncbi:FecR domain-containing protein [Bordetella sp. BOR01]|uniref:FecR domain-containing protein n=1 Tax=Bordetella sp. BOR01 TaxID=2854779 RepID=UPI001C46C089|nr:FecR family protein [Bordetella sp. BOR01]MBV7482737.1 FecR family protein [Bordetella sp. BOR01]
MSSPQSSAIDPGIAAEAADWLVLMHSGNCSPQDHQACERWRQRSTEHERAWRRAQDVLSKLGGLPPGLGRAALDRDVRHDRRAALRVLAGLAIAAPSGWLAWRVAPWQNWIADRATGVGEQRRVDLPDGSLVTLNTASAVDISFTSTLRQIVLRAGEILVESAHASPLPLLVQTAQGSVQAGQTRFTVRQFDDRSEVSVIDGRVGVQPAAGTGLDLAAGHAAYFWRDTVGPARPLRYPPQAWTQGILYADALSLADFAAEINRYRPGIVRCEPEIADLHVSGAFQLSNTDTALHAVTRSLPVQVVYRTRYWVTLAAA